MIHKLKVSRGFFPDIIHWQKTFEIRKADRPFKENDLLALNEYDVGTQCYTGNSCLVYVDYILNDEAYCKQGYVVMSIKPCLVMKSTAPKSDYKIGADYSVPYAIRKV